MAGADGKRRRPGRRPSAADKAAAESRAALAFPVVGVGASAGGVEAFCDLLQHLPPDTGVALVLIQHLAPQHKTILPEILARCTSMPVLMAQNDMEVQPDHVYVIPPGEDLTIFHGRLSLVKRTTTKGMHLPIDYFLRSLALDQGSRAIGVVLSGTASDGSLGLAAVKGGGGITFAQDPASARYDGMPTAAIGANAVDMVLDPSGIAAELTRLGRHPYLVGDTADPAAVKTQVQEDADWMNQIYVILRGSSGVDFSTYRTSTIHRRIARRIAVHKMSSLQEYADYLRTHPAEAEDLYHDILIMVTDFFREDDAFTVLADVILPRIIADKSDEDQVRVWVPGCSTGEEPYSIALSLATALREARRDLPVKVFATDISERDIQQARAGIYAVNKVQAIAEEYRRYFREVDGGYQISKGIRDMVVFARHDVTRDPPFSQLDLVSCRNVLIYLGPAAQERLIPVFHYSLRPQGFLMLGPSESIGGATDLFAPLDKDNKIFVKKDVPHRMPVTFAYAQMQGGSLDHSERGTGRLVAEQRFEPRHAADEILLSHFTPPSVVVDDDFEIMQFRGATDDYLKHGAGRASLNLLDMAREGLAPEIRRVVADARSAGLLVRRQRARFRCEGEVCYADLEAMPLRGPADERYFLVVFRPSDEPGRDAGAPIDRTTSGQDPDRGEVADLHRELEATRQYMQSITQDKEATLEELRAANEEIQSSNEELQSINEELETAKEELQSTNEELRTVNEELEHRNLQLSRANDDLNNLLRAVSVPTIMVGRDLRVRRFTPGTDRVMNLIAADIGRPITDIALRLDVPDLGALLANVIENITVEERELRDEQGHWYSMRIRPYQTEENRVEGAVLTLLDVHELRTTLARVSQATRLSDGVNRMLSALQSDHETSRVIRVILAEAAATVEADSALLLARSGGAWSVDYAHGAAPDGVEGSLMSDEQLPQAAMAETSQGTVVVKASVGLRPFPGDVDVRALVAAPLIVREAMLGVLLFTWKDHDQPDEAEVDHASKVAALLALALAATDG